MLALKEHSWWFSQRTCGGSHGAHVVVPKEHMWWFPRRTCGGSHGGHVLTDGTGRDGMKFWSYSPEES